MGRSQLKAGLLGVVALTAGLALLAGRLGAQKAPAGHVVHIRNMLFTPRTMHIAPGETVTWINDDIFLHAIKDAGSADGWRSKDLQPHDTWSRAFASSVHYVCPYHPTMVGEIVVDGSN